MNRRFVAGNSPIFTEQAFGSILAIEHRRAARTGQPFVLMLLSPQGQNDSSGTILRRTFAAVAGRARETDLIGWHEEGAVLGIIFTQVSTERCAVTELLRAKITSALEEHLGKEIVNAISISTYLFPEHRTAVDTELGTRETTAQEGVSHPDGLILSSHAAAAG